MESSKPSGAKIGKLKKAYVAYYTDVPIQKYAAMAIARDEDTIMRWRKEDPNFAYAIQRAKAEWIRKKFLEAKAEFALERLEREIFSKGTTDTPTAIPMPLVYLPQDLPRNVVTPMSSMPPPSL